jgi:hypothetical protein
MSPKLYFCCIAKGDKCVLEQSQLLKQLLASGIVQHDLVTVKDFFIALNQALGTIVIGRILDRYECQRRLYSKTRMADP